MAATPKPATNEASEIVEMPAPAAKRLVIVLTKATLDEAYPAFILATTGAATGMEVDIYFTFWGMKLLDKRSHKKAKLSPLGNPAMGMPNILAVLPGATALVTAMMKRKIKKYWPTIAEMMKQATELGVRIHACSPDHGLDGSDREGPHRGRGPARKPLRQSATAAKTQQD